MDDWTKTLAWAKMSITDWKAIATELGAEDVDDNITIANVDNADYQEAATKLQLKGIAKARLNVAVNVARKQVGIPIEDIFQKPAAPVMVSTPAAASTAILPLHQPQPGVVKNGLSAGTIWDQGCKIVVLPLGTDDLLGMRRNWTDKNELEPTEDMDPTDNQLSMISRLNVMGHNMLGFDMGVWGPYGSRRERAYTMLAHVQTADGTYIPKEVPGPEMWLTGWQHGNLLQSHSSWAGS